MAKKRAGGGGPRPGPARPSPATRALLNAIEQGDRAGVRRALADGANIDARDDKGIGAVHWACSDPVMLRDLLAAGADPERRSEVGDPPLCFAGEAEAVRVLVAAGANVDGRGFQGGTALHSAARNEALDVLQALIEAGADIGARDDAGRTPLHAAAEGSRAEAFLVLARAGADIGSRDVRGETPLDVAQAKFAGVSGVRERIALRRELAAMGRIDGRVVELVEAAHRGNLPAVRGAIAAGVDLDAREDLPDRQAVTALYLASAAGHAEVVAALIEAGASVDARIGADGTAMFDRVRNGTALMGAARERRAEVVRLLAAAGADPDARSAPGERTSLMLVAGVGQQDMVRVLLDVGADVNASTKSDLFVDHGETALSFAREAGDEAIIATLLGAGAEEVDDEVRRATWEGRPSPFNRPR